MNYYSLNKSAPIVSFKEAVINGLAPDKGLYFPSKIETLPTSFFNAINDHSYAEIAYEIINQFTTPDLPPDVLFSIIEDTLVFDFPVKTLNENTSVLELFHGPTMAFKDVGARFMARCLGYFNQDNANEVTVLVATSGDTGGAVASGFLGVKGVNVVILYPSGKVSEIQEKQLTTLGKNIRALEVDGVFDDCQDMVKKVFLDEELNTKLQLTSANSINIARWLPQMFYFLFAYKQLYKVYDEIVFSVPSGNFGNICAGMMAQRLGFPVKHFIAANNANNVVTEYLSTGSYSPKASVQTISNAMDVGNPSNFVRISEIYNNDFQTIRSNLSAFSYSDASTRQALSELYQKFNYIADPHGAVGYLGSRSYLDSHNNAHCVFLETAHPTKFLDIVEHELQIKLDLPPQIQSVMNKKKVATKIQHYDELKSFLLD